MAKTELKVLFKLDRPNAKVTSIKAFIYDNAFRTTKQNDSANGGGRIVIGTGQSVNPKHWLKDKQRCKQITDSNGKLMYENTDKQLGRFTQAVNRVFTEMNELGQNIDKDEFRELLKIQLKTAPSSKITCSFGLLGYIEDRIKNNYPVYNNKKLQGLKPRTLANKKQILTKLKGYQAWRPNVDQKAGVHPITFSSMSKEFYDSFVYYLKEELGHCTNTRGKIIKILKNFLRHAQSDGYKVNPQFTDFICEAGDPKEVNYLDESELAKIRALDLSELPHLDRVRDLFVFAAYTGFRYSDVYGFQHQWVNEREGLITYKQQKTEQTVTVPLSLPVLEILVKYNYKLPRISNQKANKHIKEVCRLAKIEDVSLINGEEIRKWQIVTTHDARRSFCSNLYHRKEPTYKIMKLSGHKTEASFLRYIGLDKKETAYEIGKSEYFNTSLRRAN